MSAVVEVVADKTALVNRALKLVQAKLDEALAERDIFTIALSGGSTPKPLYEAIAQQDWPWEKVHVFWGDERYVPPDHPDSNEGMARQAWLDRVAIPIGNIHPMPTEESDPAVAAQKFDRQLQTFFQVQPGEFPTLDLIMLGIGDDAHTASLFPHTEALQVCDRLITVGNKDGQPRLTFTVPLINMARCILFLVSGASKQAALSHIFAPEDDHNTYPARMIQPQIGEAIWLLDAAAGANFAASDSTIS